MQKYKIIVQYEGTRYQGWQRQTSTTNTIQGKLEAILTKMEGKTVEINGAGRTDAGVHALAQVADFEVSDEKTPEEIIDYVNRYLPEDIAVTSIIRVDNRFHSRLKATGKHYCYRIRNSCIRDVFRRRDTVMIREFLDVDAMREAAQLLSGTNDYAAFTSAGRSKKSTVRTVRIEIAQHDEELRFDFYGNGFLYHMARNLTGTLLEVGKGNRTSESVKDLFYANSRDRFVVTAPPEGLTLVEVFYS